jgi:hypothetical protein
MVLGVGFLGGVAKAAEDAAAPVDPEACQVAWTMASPNGEAISKGDPVPYVINFAMIDTDGDGKISADEFTKGCEKGLVKADQSTAKGME